MENYRDDAAGRRQSSLTPDAQEARRLRSQLVEYDGYLQDMRKANMKNVETLDVIQRYTDKSAAGIQSLTEEGAAGMQKLAEESLQGIQQLAAECTSGLRKFSASGEQGLSDLTEESLGSLRKLTEDSLSRIREAGSRNLEISDRVDEIRELLEAQTESLREMQKQTDEFTHRENVKVYRNVQAVVVEEVKKQTDELKEAGKGIRPLLVVTLLFSLANVALFILQILGILG